MRPGGRRGSSHNLWRRFADFKLRAAHWAQVMPASDRLHWDFPRESVCTSRSRPSPKLVEPQLHHPALLVLPSVRFQHPLVPHGSSCLEYFKSLTITLHLYGFIYHFNNQCMCRFLSMKRYQWVRYQTRKAHRVTSP